MWFINLAYSRLFTRPFGSHPLPEAIEGGKKQRMNRERIIFSESKYFLRHKMDQRMCLKSICWEQNAHLSVWGDPSEEFANQKRRGLRGCTIDTEDLEHR